MSRIKNQPKGINISNIFDLGYPYLLRMIPNIAVFSCDAGCMVVKHM